MCNLAAIAGWMRKRGTEYEIHDPYDWNPKQGGPYEDSVPRIDLFIQRGLVVCNWVMMEVLRKDSIMGRTRTIEMFIECCSFLREFGDMTGAYSVFQALDGPELQSLIRCWRVRTMTSARLSLTKNPYRTSLMNISKSGRPCRERCTTAQAVSGESRLPEPRL